MKNTEKYFYGVAGFIEDMNEINANYDKAVKRLKSAGSVPGCLLTLSTVILPPTSNHTKKNTKNLY